MKSIPSPLRIMLTAVAIICPAVSLLAKDVTLSGYTYAGKNDKILVTYALNSTDMIARVKKVVDNNRPQKESCEIPPSITVDGKKYKVTKIGAKLLPRPITRAIMRTARVTICMTTYSVSLKSASQIPLSRLATRRFVDCSFPHWNSQRRYRPSVNMHSLTPTSHLSPSPPPAPLSVQRHSGLRGNSKN